MTSLEKIKAILVYFANNTDTKYLGKVKLMKLFYFLDFGHVKKYGSPITFDDYVHLEHGPIPSKIKNLVDSFADSPDESLLSDVIKCEFPDNTNMCRILPKQDFTEDMSKLFSQSELQMLDDISVRFARSTTKQIEDESHAEAPWRETEELEAIPYYLSARDKDAVIDEESIKLFMAL